MEELDQLNATDDIKVAFSELEKGTLYPIANIEKTSTMIEGKIVTGMKVKIDHDGMSLFTYLPNKLASLSPALMTLINDAAKNNKPFNVAYYGTIGRQNIGRIHKPEEAINNKLLNDITKIPIATKRPHDNSDTNGPSPKSSKQ